MKLTKSQDVNCNSGDGGSRTRVRT